MKRTLALLAFALTGFTLAQPAPAKAPRGEFVCAVETLYDRREIRVTQLVTAAGVAVGGPGIERSPALSEAEAAPFVTLLQGELAARMADPRQWCTPVKQTDEQKYLSFDCGNEEWTQGNDRYRISADNRGFYVTHQLPSGMQMILGLEVTDAFDGPIGAMWASQHYDFQSRGLLGGGGAPSMTFTMPKPWGEANRWIKGSDGKWAMPKVEAGEVRVGNRSYRVWSTPLALVTVNDYVLSELLKSPGDFVVTAYSTERGIVARETIPRDIHAAADAQFNQGYARLLARQRDPVNQCKRVEAEDSPPIIIVD